MACMQTRSQEAQEAEAQEALLAYLGPAVLLNELLFALIWGHLSTGDKSRLRARSPGGRTWRGWNRTALCKALLSSALLHCLGCWC
ncbi:hypothetical protein FOA52_006560 [Chlamydomonas sp. UWO 241]|nr:hypothetical protein FOA52_006560 [Chlamydomonas sp. UWO 241]